MRNLEVICLLQVYRFITSGTGELDIDDTKESDSKSTPRPPDSHT